MIPQPPFAIGQHVLISDQFGSDSAIVTGIQFRPAHWRSQEWIAIVWMYQKAVRDEEIPCEDLTLLDSPPPIAAFDIFRP